jgi:hypothetical protein
MICVDKQGGLSGYADLSGSALRCHPTWIGNQQTSHGGFHFIAGTIIELNVDFPACHV